MSVQPPFQSTPPHGGRPLRDGNVTTVVVFQSTPPHGGRRYVEPDMLALGCVSIHAPARGATLAAMGSAAVAGCFNPRPRTGGDTNPPRRGGFVAWFQSTPPHGGRQLIVLTVIASIGVSIHAPARGATAEQHGGANRASVSIHAPARGATHGLTLRLATIGVSIHAPARGATAPGPR